MGCKSHTASASREAPLALTTLSHPPHDSASSHTALRRSSYCVQVNVASHLFKSLIPLCPSLTTLCIHSCGLSFISEHLAHLPLPHLATVRIDRLLLTRSVPFDQLRAAMQAIKLKWGAVAWCILRVSIVLLDGSSNDVPECISALEGTAFALGMREVVIQDGSHVLQFYQRAFPLAIIVQHV